MIRLAFGYQSRVGKDEACTYLRKKIGGAIIRFSQPLYDIVDISINELTPEKKGQKYPILLQSLGDYFRNWIGKDFFVNIVSNKIFKQNGNVFISDVRYENEAEMLKSLGFTLVHIVRHGREIDRNQNHSSETELKDYRFDYEIVNDGSLEELYRKLDFLVGKN